MFVFYLLAGVLLGVLITVHELGHFLACRAAGVRVERFSIGFGPRILRPRRGDTEYALSLVPLGGYVKMAGAELAPEEGVEDLPPDAYLAKPVAKRAFIVAAGPLTNLVFGFLVLFVLLLSTGIITDGRAIVGRVEAGSPAEAAGVAPGDRVLTIDGSEVEWWIDVQRALAPADTVIDLVVDRDGQKLDVSLRNAESDTTLAGIGLLPFIEPVVGYVRSGDPADRAGMRPGDRIVEVGGAVVSSWYEIGEHVGERVGEEVSVAWERDGELMRATVVPEADELTDDDVEPRGMIGISPAYESKPLSVLDAFTTGLSFTGDYATLLVRALGRSVSELFRGRVPTEVGGPIMIMRMASESARWGLSSFFGLMALLSVNLCIINLLPLPILDGGHLLLLLIERIRGRGLPERALLVWQQVGLVFFLSLLVALLYMDIARMV